MINQEQVKTLAGCDAAANSAHKRLCDRQSTRKIFGECEPVFVGEGACPCERFLIEAEKFNAHDLLGTIKIGSDLPIVPDIECSGNLDVSQIPNISGPRFEIDADFDWLFHFQRPLLR